LAVVEALRRLVPEYRPNRADWVAGADRWEGRGSSHAVERGGR
jgi:hypothetical protein